MSRKGDWIRTYKGVNFYPLDPRPEEILIEDIARSLSYSSRYNGHMNIFYSVALHSLMVCKELQERGYSKDLQLIGLLHDASEAYICDIPRPLKPFLTNYYEIEKNLQDMIYEKFLGRLPTEEELEILKVIDDEALLYEAENYITSNNWMWKKPAISKCLDGAWKKYIPYSTFESVELVFLETFVDIIIERAKEEEDE